ncbi:MAG: hypothetical protein JNL90_12215 [Planctomycetes bacterium]|nr:hypothetical protein [Planctomycetota bacterium]
MHPDALAGYERALALALMKVRELHGAGALPPVLEALTLIAPPRGFAAHVELRPYTDHARPDDWQRDTGWDPSNGEVHLTFEPARDDAGPRDERRDDRRNFDERPRFEHAPRQERAARREPEFTPPDPEQALRDVVGVVAHAESDPAFKFLALKYLRDQLLPRHIPWGVVQNEAQIQINRAIDAGLLVTGKVENPRMPQYPVTAVALNRDHPQVQELLAKLGGGRSGGGEAAPNDRGPAGANGDGGTPRAAEGATSGAASPGGGGHDDDEDDEPS